MARVLITGCSSGFGRAAAVELAKRGHEVVATARRPETLLDLDVEARLALDVTDQASVDAAVEAAGPLDALVNNAGITVGGPVELVPLAEVRRLFETNFFGVLRMLQAVLPGMRARGGGVVVNVSSVSGRVAAPLSGFYAASKFALEAVSEALHVEAGHFGIRVVVIEPGYFATALGDSRVRHGVDAPPYDELARQAAAIETTLSGGTRPGPELVAAAIADAVEDPPEGFRVPVGTDAATVLGARAAMDDVTFERAMREFVGLEW
ncbi:MAG TPA: SDR family NAD(P)-dependent oxidoreductase [Acidimicrobiales bacterium]|nr:SDR family NAD(P)-dependent oxidoreductase [Acidimicrobiales bacterium]